MEVQYYKDYSPALGRDMECKIYMVTQDDRFFLSPARTAAFLILKIFT